MAKGRGDSLSARRSQEVEGGVPAGSEVLGAVAQFDAAAVLAERRIPNPVELVLDVPVLAPEGKQTPGVRSPRGQAGDCMLHLDGLFSAAMRHALQTTDLGRTRPVEMLRQAGAGLEMPLHDAAMSLLHFARRRERLLA